MTTVTAQTKEMSDRFENLKRNVGGGIDGIIFNSRYPAGQKYTLDPMLGHIEKAEAGVWGDIAPLNQTEIDIVAERAKAISQSAIDDVYNLQIKSIVGNIPQSEIDTWPKQESQALAYTADNTVTVPFIQNLATARGLTLPLMAEKILVKAALYEDLSSKALGQKHAAEDAL